MMSPVSTVRFPSPSFSRLVTAVGVGASSRSDTWSATSRLISSGICRLKLRRPASTCARGMWSFAADSVAARVEFVSPYVTTTSGPLPGRTSSRRASIWPVWLPWLPGPTPRLNVAGGIASSSKKMSDMSAS